jgi:hypothetical protein
MQQGKYNSTADEQKNQVAVYHLFNGMIVILIY